MAYQKPRRSYRSKNHKNRRRLSNHSKSKKDPQNWRQSQSHTNDKRWRKNNRGQRNQKPRDFSNRSSNRGQNHVGEIVEGYLYISREGFGFLRTIKNSLASSNHDVFVPTQFIERYQLRTGVRIVARAIKKQKRCPVVFIKSVEGESPEKYARTSHFKTLVSVDPTRRIQLECDLEGKGENDLTLRLIDLITPIGFGQRALIVSPPRTGKTVILHKLANGILKNYQTVEVYVLLVDERPEEVTDFQRSCQGATVFASSLDKESAIHVELAEMTLEICRRRVESGADVVLFIDSLTRLARAFNVERGNSRRTLSGGLDASAMQKPRELFGVARCGHLGSLTIIATALIDTGSALDQVIFEEFKSTGNLELVLRRDLVYDRIFPAIDIQKSATRKEEKLREPDEMRQSSLVRQMLLRGKAKEAMIGLRKELRRYRTNPEFLQSLPLRPLHH